VNKSVETVVVSSPEAFEQAYTAYVPIEWAQNRNEVRLAIVYYRWSCFKVRALSKAQWAVDHSVDPAQSIIQFMRAHQVGMFTLITAAGTILLLARGCT